MVSWTSRKDDAGVLNSGRALVRRVALLLLLVAEIMALSLLLDAARPIANDETSLITWLMSNAALLVRFSAAFVTVLFLLTATHSTSIGEILGSDQRQFWGKYLLLHVASFALLARLSILVFDDVAAPNLFLSVAWAAFVCLVAFSWLLSVAPWQSWALLVDQKGGTLGLSAFIAGLACVLGAEAVALWDHLGYLTLSAAHGLLASVFDQVTVDREQRILGVSNFSVRIDSACSGYEGMGIVAVFLTAYVMIARSQMRWPNAYLLPLIGIACSWVGNVVRIAALIIIGAWISPSVAIGGFHSQAGWIIVCTISLCIVAISQRMPFFSKKANAGEAVEASHSDAYLLPFLVGIAVGIVSESIGLTEGPTDVARGCLVFATLLGFRRIYRAEMKAPSMQSGAVGLLAFVGWILLVKPLQAEVHLASDVDITLDQMWFPWRLAWYVVCVPIAEELAFRRYLIERVQALSVGISERYMSAIAVAVSAICFGLLHGAHAFAGAVVGVLFGIAYLRRRSVVDAVFAHAVCNATIAAYVILTGKWWIWGT